MKLKEECCVTIIVIWLINLTSRSLTMLSKINLRIRSKNIIDHSKRKGMKQRLKGLVVVQVNVTLNNIDHSILYIPDSNHNYNLNFSKQHPESKAFIETCKKFYINPDTLASEIKERLKLQNVWNNYVS
jgi:hypothetical protein